ncbi:MAG: hypothetical protein A2W91_02240 [Bacteroidetes bacterium GWF2_38_335]|nr:MAG: hypothetical protein A2W91_02240 [Bacteroidetes bacterium GWF2_38_335]OFY80671.1 MAG: hypothetical protein A2281_05255 [Bacteroidetes bacterium RIFOXYA12_FULL_38_20]HBS87014.1 hypothetical protein [Bacteroidales bacterium]
MKKLILTLFVFFSLTAAFAQPGDEQQLALNYFRNKEFDKAADLFLSLYTNTKSNAYFDYYITCLTELKNFDEAEKFVKKAIKKNPENLTFQVTLGFIYKSENKPEQAKEIYEEALKGIKADQFQVLQLASAFMTRGEYTFAERAYLDGRKIMKGNYTFHFELASLYSIQREYKKMIDEYLDLLLINESYLQNIQSRLWSSIYNNNEEAVRETLKTSLLKVIQQNPGKGIFYEMLIWYYTQEKDFKNALTHAIALDKRNKEGGMRVLTIGDMAQSGKDYNTALDAFRYVYESGEFSKNYVIAKNRYLSALYNKVFNTGSFSKKEVTELEAAYYEVLKELGESADSYTLMSELSYIQAFHLGKLDEAAIRMRKAIEMPNVSRTDVGKGKILLADILLLSGDPWEATLLYTQTEKENENNPTGYEANYKKARLAYFQGNFKWAQAQLDVLKASTSKLIANDAFSLSQLISTNSTIDTLILPLQIFSQGDFLMFRNMDSLAVLTYDSISTLFSRHSLSDEIIFRKANILEKNQDFEGAVALYEKILNEYGYDILGDDAIFRISVIYQFKLNNPEKAQESYKNLMTKYPGSIYLIEARKQYRILRGDDIETDRSVEELFFQNRLTP